MTALLVVESVVLVGLAVLVLGLLRSHAEILRALHELGAGVGDPAEAPPAPFRVRPDLPAPDDPATPFPAAADLEGVSPTGDAVGMAVVGVAHRTLLAFLSSGCLTCRDFWSAFARPDRLGLPSDVRVVVVAKDPAEESPAALARLAPAEVPVVLSSAAYAGYGVPVSPYLVLVDGPSGRVVGAGSAPSWSQVAGLLGEALADAGQRRRLPLLGTGGRGRELRADAELLAAGVRPGDPSLYPAGPEPAGAPSAPHGAGGSSQAGAR